MRLQVSDLVPVMALLLTLRLAVGFLVLGIVVWISLYLLSVCCVSQGSSDAMENTDLYITVHSRITVVK